MLVLPKNILQSPAKHRTIDLDGCTIVESCLYDKELTDSAYILDHELIYIRSGSLIVNEQKIESGEAMLIRRDAYFDFRKQFSPENHSYESVLFFLKTEFIKEFISSKLKNAKVEQSNHQNFIKIGSNDLLKGFIESLIPYFSHKLGKQKTILRLKTFELLYQLIEIERGFLHFLINLNESVKISLVEIMENNFTKKLTIEQLAAMSGRISSTFKRDFRKQFQTTPMRWIKSRRLKLAKQLIENSQCKPNEIYLDVGFEDYSHFSREFKKEFGLSPSQLLS